LARIRLKPMRSQSGVQTVSVLTKPFPCPGQCIFCPNDIRMPTSYIASEPGAQRAERNSFDPYLQTYSRLEALRNMGHEPSKIEIIVLGGTWSYYPESYQIWFIHECFRALNDFAEGKDDRPALREQIKNSVQAAHRSENRVIHEAEIRIDGRELVEKYNQVVSKHYLEPEIRVEGSILVRREQKTWEELEYEQQRNEKSSCKNVGLTIETRPDNISEAEVERIRRLGCTRAQIGFQSLSDEVLRLNKRGHDVAATRRAVQLLRKAGFKIHAHWMPNLYGSTLQRDKQEFLTLFSDPDFMPDELKIYPCALIPSAELMQNYERGEWVPYSAEELEDLITFCLTNAPAWVRLSRVIRDIPSTETYTDHFPTNLRQIAQQRIEKRQLQQKDIRSREIGKQNPNLPISFSMEEYQTASTREVFLQYTDANNRLLGFLRLSLPNQESYVSELKQNAIIRELHVYGQVERVGQEGTSETQHRGLGKQLIEKAEALAQKNGYSALSVISAIGTREYYEKLGFSLEKYYQHKAV
jgi:elongator complex protein 3